MPDYLTAECSRAEAERLIGFDHHLVNVGGRWGVMFTYEWMRVPLDQAVEPFLLGVVFRHLKGHPLAPVEVQSIVDTLVFSPSEAPW